MAQLIISAMILSLLLPFGCARYQNTQVALSPYHEIPIKYRIGNLESKHSKELHEFIRNNYSTLLTVNADAPIINASFINLQTKKPALIQQIAAGLTMGFIKREFSVNVRCILQAIKDNKIISESKAEGTGRVESWGYFAFFREQDVDWAIDPAELEAEKNALSSAIDIAILGKK